MKHTEHNTIVYPLCEDRLVKFANGIADSLLSEHKKLITRTDHGIIKVPGGFLLVDADCCYGYSDTVLFKPNIISECLDIQFAIKESTPSSEGGFVSNTRGRFYIRFEAEQLLSVFAKDPVDLKTHMGSRYNYNGRIKINMEDLLRQLTQLNSND